MSELRRRLMMRQVGGGVSRLPQEYQQVEWIGSNGVEYIGLPYDGYSFVDYMKIDFYHVVFNGFGKLYDSSNTPLGISGSNKSNYMKFKNVVVATFDNTIRNTIIIENSNVLVNGVVVATIDTTSTSLINFGTVGIFKARGATPDDYWRGLIGKLFEFEIRNDMYHYHLIPCYRKSDKVAGMYDIVSQQFYTNAGSGSFTVGPDVS